VVGLTDLGEAVVPDPPGELSEHESPAEIASESEPEPDSDLDPLRELTRTVATLGEQAGAYHSRAQARERVIERLHAEVERLRVGEQALFLRPVVTDLQNLRRELLQQAGTVAEELTREQVTKLLESFALSVELALERCGTVPIRPQVGDAFSAQEHRAVRVTPAADPSEHQTISAVLAEGYLDTTTGRATAPARVEVRSWEPPAEEPVMMSSEEARTDA
jgi:hypothetical protein